MKKTILLIITLQCLLFTKVLSQQDEKEALDSLLKISNNFGKEFLQIGLGKRSLEQTEFYYPDSEILKGAGALYRFNIANPESDAPLKLRGEFYRFLTKNYTNNTMNNLTADTLNKYPGCGLYSLNKQIEKTFNLYEKKFMKYIHGVLTAQILSNRKIVVDFIPPIEYVIYKVRVNEIFAGLGKIKKGDIIEIWTSTDWGGAGYQEGNTYLINLGHRQIKDDNGKVVTPKFEICVGFPSSYGVFPVEDSIIIDEGNVFGFGKNADLNLVKQYIVDFQNKLLNERGNE